MTAHRPDSGVGRWALGVGFVLVLLPFVNILHFALPLPALFNKSAWLVLSVGALAAMYLWVERPWSAGYWRYFRSLLVVGALLLLVCFVRALAYNEPAFPIYLRFAVTMVVCLGLAEAMLRREKAALVVLSGALILQGMLVSLVVFINMNFFPSVRLDDNEHGLVGLTKQGYLTRSMLINASIGANHILCAMLVLYAVLWYRCKKSVRNLCAFWCVMFFMAFCISLLGSRYPIAVALMLVGLAAVQLRSNNSFISMLFALLMLFVLNLGTVILQQEIKTLDLNESGSLTLRLPLNRLEEDSGSRVEKALLAIKMLGSSTKSFLIGPSWQEIARSTTDRGVKFSDNSYAMLMLGVGVPAALLWFVSWGLFLRRYTRSPLAIFCIVYFAGVLLLTNGLLWESWVWSILFTLVVVASYSGGTRTQEAGSRTADIYFKSSHGDLSAANSTKHARW